MSRLRLIGLVTALSGGRSAGAGLMVVSPRVKVKPIKRDSALADRDLGEVGPHLGIEAIAIHPQISRGVAIAEQTREQGHGPELGQAGTYPAPAAVAGGLRRAAQYSSHARSRSARSKTRVVPHGVGEGSLGLMCFSKARRLRPR